jgi:hypothetical protein
VNIRRVALAGVIAAAAVLTGACDEDADRKHAAPRGEHRLTSQVATIQEAVIAEDPIAARSAVRDLQGSVTDLQEAGEVSSDRAGRILAAAQMVLDELSLLPSSSTVDPSRDAEESMDGGGDRGEEHGVPPNPEPDPGDA